MMNEDSKYAIECLRRIYLWQKACRKVSNSTYSPSIMKDICDTLEYYGYDNLLLASIERKEFKLRLKELEVIKEEVDMKIDKQCECSFRKNSVEDKMERRRLEMKMAHNENVAAQLVMANGPFIQLATLVDRYRFILEALNKGEI